MGARLRAKATNTRTSTGSGNLTVNKPPGTENNDWLVAVCSSSKNNNGTIGLPAGFTELWSLNSFQRVGYKLAASEGSSYAFACGNPDGSAAWTAAILAYKDGDPTVAPTIGTVTTQTNSYYAAAGIDLAFGAGVLVFIGVQGTDADGTVVSVTNAPTGEASGETELNFYFTEQVDINEQNGSNGQCSLYIADTTIIKPGGTGTKLATLIASAAPVSKTNSAMFLVISQPTVARQSAPGPVEILLEVDSFTEANLATNPNGFSTGDWTKLNTTIDSSGQTNPFGNSNASTIDETSANANHQIYQYLSSLKDDTEYFVGGYLKKGSRNWCAIRFVGKATNIGWSYFDLNSGVLGSNSGGINNIQMTPLNSGWYYCGFSMNVRSGGTTPDLSFNISSTDQGVGLPSYVGTTGNDVLIYQAGIWEVMKNRYSQRGMIYPDNSFYEARIVSSIVIAQKGSDAISLGGRAALTVSVVDLFNGDDALNTIVRRNLALARPVVIKTMPAPTAALSDCGGGALSGASTVFTGVVASAVEPEKESEYTIGERRRR
jgi:hypothetical protein